MKALQIILSVLFVVFATLFGAFLGVNNYNKELQKPVEKAERFVVYPLPQIVTPKAEAEISQAQDIDVVAPGAKALYLSGKNKDGESITEAETAVVNGLGTFKWDTSDYKNGDYYLYVTAYYQSGAPSKTAIQLKVNNETTETESIIDNSKVLATNKKADPDKVLAKSEYKDQEEILALDIDKELRVDSLEAGEQDGAFQVLAKGFAKPNSEVSVRAFSQVKAQTVRAGEEGKWEARFDLEGGRHQIYAVSDGKRSVVGEVYLAEKTVGVKLPSRNELKESVIRYGAYFGGPSLLMVFLVWLVGISFRKRVVGRPN